MRLYIKMFDLLASVVHPSEVPDVHDGIHSMLDGKCSTPKLLIYMMANS